MLSFSKLKLENCIRRFKILDFDQCFYRYYMLLKFYTFFNHNSFTFQLYLKIKSFHFLTSQVQYQIYLMNYYTPVLEQHLQARASKEQPFITKKTIGSIRTDLPVLSTIVDYGGSHSVEDILEIQDEGPKYYNKFQKILQQFQDRPQNQNNRKYINFLDYKHKPSKETLGINKSKSKARLKTSVIVEMPTQLKKLKQQILQLPSIGNSRFTSNTKLNNSGFRLIQDLKKSKSRRYETEASRFDQQRKSYLTSLNGILTQFDSPQINCNSQYMQYHYQCKKILNEEEMLGKQYRRFQSLGSPPKSIIRLKNLLHSFQQSVEKNLDAQVSQKILNMDSKKYDIVLKHEEEVRRLNMQRFQHKKKMDKVEQSKQSLTDNNVKTDSANFKLNSKGKLIYFNKNKSTS